MAANFPISPQALVVFTVPFILAFGGSLDILLLCFFALVRNWDAFQAFIDLYFDPTVVIDIAKAGAALFTLLQTARYVVGLKEVSSPSNGFPTKPMILPCRTSHTRMFPKTHSFSYSYLWVGIPVGWKGSIGGMLSCDNLREPSPWYMRLFSLTAGGAWLTVNGDDYLGRGHVDGGLEEKLRHYLQDQGIDSKDFPYAYLLTAPCFLNYASNPVSIWHLYSAQKELKAFILEVNNTFDERHVYFVRPDIISSSPPNSDIPPKLVNTWPKDFYVSTFNSRAGNYSISAIDPLFPSMTSSGVINTTVTLKSAYATLVARIFTTGPAIDPSTMSVWEKTKFLAAWWWVGLATFPRTILQALILLAKRKMPWVFRPEPRRNTMPRHADPTEIFIEGIFRKYLRNLVEKCEHPIVINYSPAGLVHGRDEIMISPSAQLTTQTHSTIELKVLTPSFYSRFVHYVQDATDVFAAEARSATVEISNLDMLSKLKDSIIRQFLNPLEHPRFLAIQTLRTKPLSIENLGSPAQTSPTETKTAGSPVEKSKTPVQLSPFESFVLINCRNEANEYASRILKLFISDHIALGRTDLLDLEVLLVRSRVAWVIAGLLRW